jgi:hypothetical protein
MCVEAHLTGSLLLDADITSAVAPLVSVPGMADRLPSVSATPSFLPVGNAPVIRPIRLWMLLVYWSGVDKMSFEM